MADLSAATSALFPLDPVPSGKRVLRPLVRRLTAIAFLDVVGFSRLMSVDEEATLGEWSALQRTIIEPTARAWRGRIAGRAGDGLFLQFDSALDVFRWAVEVQEAIGSRAFATVPLQVRVALHLGDVIDDAEGEVQGDGVNVAARLQAHAEPGGIVVSQAIADEVLHKTTARFRDLGLLKLKNIPRPVRAFGVLDHARAPSPRRAGLQNVSASCATTGPARYAARGRLQLAAVTLTVLLVLPLSRSSPWGIDVDGRPPAATAPVRQTAMRLPGKSQDVACTGYPCPPESLPTDGLYDPAVAMLPFARAEAVRLLNEGQAVVCLEHPCPREWLASRALYEQAIAKDPTFGLPYAYAALTYTIFIANDLSLDEGADLRTAERLATQAAALAPSAAISYRARGAVLEMQPDRLEDALAAYQRSLAIDPEQAPVRGKLGWLLILLGRAQEAEPLLVKALADAPAHLYAPGWLTYLGLAELFLDHVGHGASQFRQAIAQQSRGPANVEIAMQRSIYLAAALALNGDIDEAKRIVDEMRRQSPTVSLHSIWNCDCSREVGYLTGFKMLVRGAALAGITDAL